LSRGARGWGFALAEIFAPWRLVFLGGSELASRIDIAVVERSAYTSSPVGLFPGRLPSKNEITLRNFRFAARPHTPRLRYEPAVKSPPLKEGQGR
jgi:hypothetical protein